MAAKIARRRMDRTLRSTGPHGLSSRRAASCTSTIPTTQLCDTERQRIPSAPRDGRGCGSQRVRRAFATMPLYIVEKALDLGARLGPSRAAVRVQSRSEAREPPLVG